ncbi:AAA family ATPase [Nocardioides anomalus]|uniref:AAA family ATPase n=1 Tax=Nocardioides anomalus TaxID=2712223 RepID=A0A6G6W7S2_9ACTN|nr:BTAD domain-containing putative transcriptional regulator [Nocardioides anomalus]QIG41391.1 AAA family ATPase [Nocardioides anomalus]
MQIDVLGPVRARRGSEPVDLGTPRQRAIVAALALSGGRALGTDTLIGRVWGADAPSGALATLHGYVAALRRALEPDRAPRAEPRVLVTEGDGYALRGCEVAADAVELETAVAAARSALTVVPDHLRPAVEPARRLEAEAVVLRLEAALAGWRGEPYADLRDDADAQAERVRLTGLRTAAQELRVVALLALGRHGEVLPGLEQLTAEHPLHERWWALYAVALTRSHRQADALAALQSLRNLLADELGVDPSPAVRDLQTAILRQDPTVAGTAAPAPPPVDDLGQEPVPRREHFRESPPLPRWRLAGRRAELARLGQQLDEAEAGRPRAVLVTGEAGIGKSRLVHELALTAFERGFTVALGQCSAEGPPPLWPFRAIARSLEEQLDLFHTSVEQALLTAPPDDFATLDLLAHHACLAAAGHPLLLVVEDVQWADPASLRLLLRILEKAKDERLLVVTTWRRTASTPEVEEFAAASSRHEGVRLDLAGLPPEDAETLVTEVVGAPADADLWERTSGNPFFLIELARSAGSVSGSLTDVVLSRVRQLPEPTVRFLEAAAVVDLEFDLDLVSFMTGRDTTEGAAVLQPALHAGLVVDAGHPAPVYRFSHGVVREVVHDSIGHTERARLHRAVSTVLAERSQLRRVVQRAALVHHWQLTGGVYRREAWRGVLLAADAARREGAYAEEAAHLAAALELQWSDHEHDLRERFELLMLRVEACRWQGDWAGVSDAVDEAVRVAEQLEDTELATRAAISTMEGALWQVRPFGHVHAPIVEALQRALERLGPDQAALRARAQLALAMELYYGDDTQTIDALVAEALAVTEASPDLRLRATAYLGAFAAQSRPETLEARRRYAAEAVVLAGRIDDVRLRLAAEALATSAAAEAGDYATVRRDLPRVVELCRGRGLGTAEAILRVVQVPWLVMDGRGDEAAEPLARLEELSRELRMPNIENAVLATGLVRSFLDGEYAALAAFLSSFVDASAIPAGPVATVIALRAGHDELARALHDAVGVDLETRSFMSLMNAALALEIALGLGDRELAARVYPRVLPFAGRMCSAGTATPVGPVDAYLALGAAALGDRAAAERHAARARELVEEWGLPVLRQRWAELEERYLA